MRKALIATLLGFAVSLAAVVGIRLSAEAMAVVVGVVCGVAAAVPMSLLLLLVASRRDRHMDACGPYGQYGVRSGAYPPVVVIQGGTPLPSELQPFHGASLEAAPRRFHIVGADE